MPRQRTRTDRPDQAAGLVRAGLYGRISLARFGETIKVTEQLSVCEGVAGQRGWEVTRRYGDPNKSAWRKDRIRPGWNQMLADVDANLIDAIVVYHGDRLVRQPWDLELLLRLADEKGIRLASPTGERNLDNADDRYILRIEAAGACRESDNTSRRLKRHYDLAAERGVVRLGGRGGRAFGFEPDGVTVREDDAKWIREIAGRMIAGESTTAIASDISARGCRTTAGNEWGYSSLGRLMVRARLAGLVSHHGEIIGKAVWPAILEREQWETLCAVLERRAEKFGWENVARRYLLTGIALCGNCLETIVIRHSVKGTALRGYGCINPKCKKKAHRSMAHLDEYVIGYVLRVLGNSDLRKRLSTKDGVDWSAKLTQLRETRQRRIDEFADDDDAPSDIIKVTIRRIDKQIAEVRAAMAKASEPEVLDGAWGIDRAAWEDLTQDRRRAIIRRIATITLLPSRRGPGFDPSAVKIEPLLPV